MLGGRRAALAPTPRDTLLRDGSASLYRFRRPEGAAAAEAGAPLLLVPSLINRWTILDLRAGASLAAALVDGGLDTFCLDWGVPGDEDRHLSWHDVLRRLARMVRRVRRLTGARRVALLGYCMGGTLCGVHTALHPREVAAFVNLAGPFDFAHGGLLARMVDARWFDPHVVAEAGNVGAAQMQSGFMALRPTAQVAKWVGALSTLHDPARREAFEALEAWAGDNIPFPAAAYRTYIEELYQRNLLVAGEHRVEGRRVRLSEIRCPLLTIAATRDTICPLPAARALGERAGSEDSELHVVPGGHVGAVVGRRAPLELYPHILRWLRSKLSN